MASLLSSSCLITSADKEKIKRSVPKESKIIGSAVARLYVAYPNPSVWKFTGISGAVLLVNDLTGGTFFLKISDINGVRGVIWDQELYLDFEYNQDRSFFHTFELEECFAGLLFSDESEARQFLKKVKHRDKYASKSTFANTNAVALKKTPDSYSMKGPRGNELHYQKLGNSYTLSAVPEKTEHVHDNRREPSNPGLEKSNFIAKLKEIGVTKEMLDSIPGKATSSSQRSFINEISLSLAHTDKAPLVKGPPPPPPSNPPAPHKPIPPSSKSHPPDSTSIDVRLNDRAQQILNDTKPSGHKFSVPPPFKPALEPPLQAMQPVVLSPSPVRAQKIPQAHVLNEVAITSTPQEGSLDLHPRQSHSHSYTEAAVSEPGQRFKVPPPFIKTGQVSDLNRKPNTGGFEPKAPPPSLPPRINQVVQQTPRHGQHTGIDSVKHSSSSNIPPPLSGRPKLQISVPDATRFLQQANIPPPVNYASRPSHLAPPALPARRSSSPSGRQI